MTKNVPGSDVLESLGMRLPVTAVTAAPV